jgi:hypothetical protein
MARSNYSSPLSENCKGYEDLTKFLLTGLVNFLSLQNNATSELHAGTITAADARGRGL